jgi:uncharacterized membrane protein SirB2
MALLDHHAALRHLHLGAVGFSLGLFAVRGIAVLLGQRWALSRPARVASWAIDAVLLTAGVLLWTALGLNPAGPDTWLGTKLVLLLAYIGLGSGALRHAPTRAAQAACLVAAWACAATMVGIALAHHPAGWWR